VSYLNNRIAQDKWAIAQNRVSLMDLLRSEYVAVVRFALVSNRIANFRYARFELPTTTMVGNVRLRHEYAHHFGLVVESRMYAFESDIGNTY